MNSQNQHWNLAIGLCTGIFFAGLAALLFFSLRGPAGIILTSAPTQAPIIIELRGEVNNPGQYALPPGSRVKDALLLADGLTPNAKPDSINLARKLVDGELIIIPNRSIPENHSDETLININRATAEELEALPHIGPVLAKEIVAYRERYGPFQQLDELMNVPGIGEVTFNEIKLWVTLIDP